MNNVRRGSILLGILFVLGTPVFVQSTASLYHMVFPDNRADHYDATRTITFGETWTDHKIPKTYHGHLGEDFLMAVGSPVYAIADGEISMIRDWPGCDDRISSHGWGGVVQIKHELESFQSFDITDSHISVVDGTPSRVHTLYGHLGNILVEDGDIVRRGEKIGEIAKVCPYVPHLHLEVKDQHGFHIDEQHSEGPGFGYSGKDMHAPNRYRPSTFIMNNQYRALFDNPLDEPFVRSYSDPIEYLNQIVEEKIPSLRDEIEARMKKDFVAINDEEEPAVIAHTETVVDDETITTIQDDISRHESMFSSVLKRLQDIVSISELQEEIVKNIQHRIAELPKIQPVPDVITTTISIVTTTEPIIGTSTIEASTTTVEIRDIKPLVFKDPFLDFADEVENNTLRLSNTKTPYLWYRSDSAAATIPQDHTLILGPGVSLVSIDTDATIRNKGTIICEGTKDNITQIIAGSAYTGLLPSSTIGARRWGSIDNQGGQIILEHCNIEGGGFSRIEPGGFVFGGKNIATTITNRGGGVLINNSTISQQPGDELDIDAVIINTDGSHENPSRLEIRNTNFHHTPQIVYQRHPHARTLFENVMVEGILENELVADFTFGSSTIGNISFVSSSSMIDVGVLEVEGTKTLEPHITYIVSDIVVQSSSTLVLPAGSTLKLQPRADIQLGKSSSLIAEGTSSSPVTITKYGSGNWGSIIASRSSTVDFMHTVVEKGNNSQRTQAGQGVIVLKRANLFLNNIEIMNNRRPFRSIDAHYSQLLIASSSIGYDSPYISQKISGVRGYYSTIIVDDKTIFPFVPTPYELSSSKIIPINDETML